MSQQYTEYLQEHIATTNNSIHWMLYYQVIPQETLQDIQLRQPFGLAPLLSRHDDSKWSPEEYDAYDDYFYGKDQADPEDIPVIDSTFDYAWLHHIHNNPHHWQYWVLIGDDDGTKALEMPEEYVYEMIADWWSFSWMSGNLKEIFKWYDEHKSKMILHEKTRKLVEDTLDRMRDALDKEERPEDEETH